MRKREALAGLNHYECQEGGYVMRKFLFEVPTATDLNNGMHVFSHVMMGPGIGHLWGQLTQCLKVFPPSEISIQNTDRRSRSREITSQLLWKRREVCLNIINFPVAGFSVPECDVCR